MKRRNFIVNGLLPLVVITMANTRPKRIQMSAQLSPATGNNQAYFTLNKPNGTVTVNTTTDVNGGCSALFNLRRQDPPGTYSGQVDIFVNGVRVSDFSSVEI